MTSQQICLWLSLRVVKNIPTTKDVEPLLEIDGDVRSFEVFLSSRTPVLTARDIRTFLPCTVNLDPKLREIIAGTPLSQVRLTSPWTPPLFIQVLLSFFRRPSSSGADEHGWSHISGSSPARASAPPHLSLQPGVIHLLAVRFLQRALQPARRGRHLATAPQQLLQRHGRPPAPLLQQSKYRPCPLTITAPCDLQLRSVPFFIRESVLSRQQLSNQHTANQLVRVLIHMCSFNEAIVCSTITYT